MAADTTDLALTGAGNRHARSLDLGAVAALPVTVRAGAAVLGIICQIFHGPDTDVPHAVQRGVTSALIPNGRGAGGGSGNCWRNRVEVHGS